MAARPPSEGELARRLEALSPEQRERLRARLQARRTAPGTQRIARRPGSGPAPLSFGQELMWLLHELTPGMRTYNSFGAWRIATALDPSALQAAIDGLARRHDTLRTTFERGPDGPLQVVHDTMPLPLTVLERPGAGDAELDEMLVEMVREPFDLATPPLFRFTLVRTREDECVFVMVTNHIVWDGWSNGVMWPELSELYVAAREDRPAELPPLPIQYSDYAVWQREGAQDAKMAEELAHWRAVLDGAPPLLELPIDRPRPPVKTENGDRMSLWLDEDTREALEALGVARGATMFMLVTALWATFLHRITGQDDIVVGTPTASRNEVDVEGLIGYFANTLALRVDCSGDPTFASLLARVRATVVDALANQDVPFERVLRAVATRRDQSYSPVFQSLVVFQNAAEKTQRIDGHAAELLFVGPRTAKFDLTMGMGVRGGRLHASFEFNTDLFSHASVERLRAQFERMVASVITEPEARLSALALVDDAERERLLRAGRGPDTPVAGRTLHEAFASCALAAPDAPALRWRDTEVSYGELARRAQDVADALRARGVDAGSRVGLAFERCPERVIALLGVLGAGAVAVPIDPAYPAERVRTMVDAAEVALVLGDDSLVLDAGVPTVCLSQLVAPGAMESEAPTVAAACVLFTSGSTGVPKGVVLEHRGLLNEVTAMIDRHAIGAADRILQFASPSFDIALEETFCALLSGATLVLLDDYVPLDGEPFVAWLERQGITILDLPTAFWHAWVRDLGGRGSPPPGSLRLLIVGGERVAPGAFDRWRALAPHVGFANTYGPTETSIVATSFEPPAGWTRPGGTEVPIGVALPNVATYVLDAAGGPVPDGARGELHIGGAGVAQGYLNAPDQTRERFVTLPWSGERVYRTGDVVRRLPSGDLVFVGRDDDQVKLRGHRIEPGEVEAALVEVPEVEQAVVRLHAESDRDPILAAYVVGTGAGPRPDAAALRRALAARLPAYAIPDAVVVLDDLPLTANGKVDAARLPAPARDRSALEAPLVAPRTPTEHTVAAIWSELLDRRDIGVEDNFFALGGHSLLGMRVLGRLRRELGCSLTLRAVFDAPTIAQLAALADAAPLDDAIIPAAAGRGRRGRRPPA